MKGAETALGDILRSREAGLTQEELAERAGLSVHAVSALERGARTRPHKHTINALARAMALSTALEAELMQAARSGGAGNVAGQSRLLRVPEVAWKSVGGFLGARPAHPMAGRDDEVARSAEAIQDIRSGRGAAPAIATDVQFRAKMWHGCPPSSGTPTSRSWFRVSGFEFFGFRVGRPPWC
ncbi:MAG TPA: helix-turn-helix transcriptional regulator [Chloroflexota bacterium]|nr:helix-turn-helix transcriptional regulator [Chloroflexota bacterium]